MRNIERRKKLNSMTDGDDISMTSSMYSRRKSVTFQGTFNDTKALSDHNKSV